MTSLFPKTNSVINYKSPSQIRFSRDCISSLGKNHRESYRNVASRLISGQQPYENIPKYERRLHRFHNAILLSNGEIYTGNDESSRFRNGACSSCTNPPIPKLNYQQIWNQHQRQRQNKMKKVISATGTWSYGIWHFPAETLTSFMLLSREELQTSAIHLEKNSNYIRQWMDIMDIPTKNIITGNILTENVIIPEQGRCGGPYLEQIKWLQQGIQKKISTKEEPQNLLIVIRRSNRRVPKNQTQLEKICSHIAKKRGLELYIHDDKTLPPVLEQLSIFHRAKIVVSPHGAGGIMCLGCRPNTLMVEFLNKEDMNLCYFNLCYRAGIHYLGLTAEKLVLNLRELLENIDTFKDF